MPMFPHQSQEAQDASARVAEKAYNALTGDEKKALLDQAAKVIDSLHREREAGLKDGTWPTMDDGRPLAINDDPVAHAKNALMHNGYIYQSALDDLTERRSDAPAAAVPVQAAVENSNPAITPNKVEALTAAISQMKDASGEPKFSPERAAQLSAGIAEHYNEYVQQHGNAASSRRAAGVVIDGALQTPEALGHLVGGQQRREIHAHVIIPNHPASQSPAPAHNNHMIDAAMTDKLAAGIQSLGYSEADAHKLAEGLADNYNQETDPAKIHIHQNAIRVALGEPDPNTGLAVDENVRRGALERLAHRQERRAGHDAHVAEIDIDKNRVPGDAPGWLKPDNATHVTVPEAKPQHHELHSKEDIARFQVLDAALDPTGIKDLSYGKNEIAIDGIEGSRTRKEIAEKMEKYGLDPHKAKLGDLIAAMESDLQKKGGLSEDKVIEIQQHSAPGMENALKQASAAVKAALSTGAIAGDTGQHVKDVDLSKLTAAASPAVAAATQAVIDMG